MVTITWVGMTPQRLASLADADALVGKPLRDALQRSAITVQGDAKRGAPVDTGRLRASITSAVDASAIPRFATIGTNVEYARAVHDGRPPGTRVSPMALETWSRRHGGRNPYAVAAGIAKRGTKAQPFLRDAFAVNVGRIRGYFERAGREIEAAWQAGR